MGISNEDFYDPRKVAIVPMGFCFPGTGKSGDLPPRMECAPAWREQFLGRLKRIELTLVIGQYALAYHLSGAGASLTEVVSKWRDHWPAVLPLPHPSPRNQLWLKRNPWFEEDVLPALRLRVATALSGDG
jgi:uracil-DNA glycosylase